MDHNAGVTPVVAQRPVSMIAREAVRGSNWVALARMPRRYPDLLQSARRYFGAGGDYPWDCRVRTPLGVVAARLHGPHDMFTVNEVFCRVDYRAGPDDRVVVDVGSNIGISALYFLTRAPDVRCHLFEPVPRNVERLRSNLHDYEHRYTLEPAAVADRAGTVAFGVESTGRYGGIGVATAEAIEVRCLEINDVLERVLDDAPAIDVLKLDTEGAEAATVRAIRPDLLARVRRIYLETGDPAAVDPDGFDAHFASDTLTLTNRAPQREPEDRR
jgi:FkbM family methyltransferase